VDTITAQRPTKKAKATIKAADVAAAPKKYSKPALVATGVRTPQSRLERFVLAMMLLSCGAFIAVMVAYVLFPAMSSLLTPSSEWTGTGP
jgi:hypothetical protein